MTEITQGELKIVLFALFFTALMSAFISIYNQSPAQPITYRLNSTISSDVVSSDDGSWISRIITDLPPPFNDSWVLLIFGIIITPLTVMLLAISLRYIKDLVTQWV